MGQHQRKHYRRKRHFRFTRIYGVLCVLLVLAAIVGGSIVFFRVDVVEVEGNDRYSTEEIIAITGIEQGDNMFLLNKFEMIEALEGQLTYVDDVVIRRKLPSTIRIAVEECTVAAAARDEATGQWWYLSAEGKLLEQVSGPGDYLAITGLRFVDSVEGGKLAVEQDARLKREALVGLLTSMEARSLLADADSIDLSAAGTVTMQYAGRLEVRMKLSSDFDYQMRVLATVMEEYVLTKWAPEDIGTLDMTLDDGLPHLRKKAAEN